MAKVIDKRERFQATGRRKTSTARVTLFPGETGFLVNGKPMAEYIDCPDWPRLPPPLRRVRRSP